MNLHKKGLGTFYAFLSLLYIPNFCRSGSQSLYQDWGNLFLLFCVLFCIYTLCIGRSGSEMDYYSTGGSSSWQPDPCDRDRKRSERPTDSQLHMKRLSIQCREPEPSSSRYTLVIFHYYVPVGLLIVDISEGSGCTQLGRQIVE